MCRFLWTLIDASGELQYVLELYSLGYVLPDNPRQELTYAARLEILREHRKRWDSIMDTKPTRYTLHPPATGRTSSYHFYGGVYALGWPLSPGSGPARRLDLYQLPSVNKGIEYRHWSHPDVGADIYDLTMEPDLDLLVLLELGESLPIIGAAQDSLNTTQHFNIYLRSLESCAPHSDAAHPIINHSVTSFGGALWVFHFQVVGRYLAVLFLQNQRGENSTYQLVVWDWTTGNTVTVSSARNTLQEDSQCDV